MTAHKPMARLIGAGPLRSVANGVLGMICLLGLWWLGGEWVRANPDLSAFASFAPGPALARLWEMIVAGEIGKMAGPSLMRVGMGLFFAALIGIPVGILIGSFRALNEVANAPFQFLRMISPLAWMPIAVMAFATWDGAIIFLVTMASVWPILLSTAAGVRRIDPAWMKVARNLGAGPFALLRAVVLPAIAVDILQGLRLALGVAWVVLVPAEYLGVTSGLGFAINDARDTLDYDRLAATVVVIGIIGFIIDSIAGALVRHFNWRRG